jgi:transcriptional regulator with XRE-family HTH domain
MKPTAYGEILAKNIRSRRARLGLGQESLADRMRRLGFTQWNRQIVGSTEKPTRRVTAEEIFGLALALETTMPRLLQPALDDKDLELPDARSLSVKSVAASAFDFNDGAVTWDKNNQLVLGNGVREWWGDRPGAGSTRQEVFDKALEAED